MLVTTTNEIPGWQIQRVIGEVFGLTWSKLESEYADITRIPCRAKEVFTGDG